MDIKITWLLQSKEAFFIWIELLLMGVSLSKCLQRRSSTLDLYHTLYQKRMSRRLGLLYTQNTFEEDRECEQVIQNKWKRSCCKALAEKSSNSTFLSVSKFEERETIWNSMHPREKGSPGGLFSCVEKDNSNSHMSEDIFGLILQFGVKWFFMIWRYNEVPRAHQLLSRKIHSS